VLLKNLHAFVSITVAIIRVSINITVLAFLAKIISGNASLEKMLHYKDVDLLNRE
jgi:hypothetical protein